MLDHPEEMFANYYRSILIFQKQKLKNYRHLTLSSPGPQKRYYARRLAPRVDIRIVLVALVTIVSALLFLTFFSAPFPYQHHSLSILGLFPSARYYARRLAPRVDIRIVLVALVTIVSALQYYIAWFNFEAAISHLATVPKYRLQVKPLTLLGRVEQFVNLSSLGHAHC